VPAAIGGIAAPSDQEAVLELVEQSDHIGGIQAQGIGETVLTHRSVLTQQPQGDEVPGTKPTRRQLDLDGATSDAGQVLEQR
jgi:hypothetical protein